MTRQNAIAITLASLLVAACGGSATDAPGVTPPAGQTVTVSTAPAETEIAPETAFKFSAQVTGTADGSVSWAVAEADGGTVDASGLYTAPANEGTFHVRASSRVSASSGGTSVVRVKKGAVAPVVVAVDPATATVPAGGSHAFAAAVTGTTTRTVTWTVLPGSNCGTVSAAGLYTAPNEGATCQVVATSVADATKSASATVTVTPPPPHVVAVTPGSAAVYTGGTVTFAATVTGTTAGESTSVTWSVPAGAGTIGATTGVYVAPATPGTYVVTATSVATPSGTRTANVTVTAAPVIAVSVTPGTASIVTGGTVTFTASVTGTITGQSTAATWSVPAGAGTINASTGVYVAPATAGAYTVTATSVADGTKKGTATVTVTAPPPPAITISISPATATLDACATRAFTATVGNSTNTAVTWTMTEADGGTVTSGSYLAPTTAGTFHVVARSVADPTKTATATVVVGPERVLSVAVTPGSGTVAANGQLGFGALVTTSCGVFAAQ
jgi:hypothetical protein